MQFFRKTWPGFDALLSELTVFQPPGYVCLVNAHSFVTAAGDARLDQALRQAAFALPDGAPVAALCARYFGVPQERLSGPELMLLLCRHAEVKGEPVYFYGSSPVVLQAMEKNLRAQFPQLRIAGMESPPFSKDVTTVDEETRNRIRTAAPRFLFVGLGCPKQEIWMHMNAPLLEGSILIGVGAAFDFTAGSLKRAPEWMRRAGLEWFHRLMQEPGRLWRRYLVTNTRFLWMAFRLLASRPK